jgi:hypothetical protein
MFELCCWFYMKELIADPFQFIADAAKSRLCQFNGSQKARGSLENAVHLMVTLMLRLGNQGGQEKTCSTGKPG